MAERYEVHDQGSVGHWSSSGCRKLTKLGHNARRRPEMSRPNAAHVILDILGYVNSLNNISWAED